MDWLSGSGDKINVPDSISSRLKSRNRYILTGFSRPAQNGADIASVFMRVARDEDEP